MKILLAYHSGSAAQNESTLFTDLLPIGLCSLHAMLRSKGYDAALANLSAMSRKQVSDLLLQIQPDLIGLSQWTHNRQISIQLARHAKRLLPDCTIVLGGGHATHQAESILSRHSEVDLIVMGEGEQTLLELIQALQSKQNLSSIPGLALRQPSGAIKTAVRPRITNLDCLPFPASYLHEAYGVDLELQPQFISTSRGCPSACRFCASPTFWGTSVQTRTPSSVVDEFLFLRNQFGMIYLSLRDDTFTADKKRVIELCHLLLERRANMFWNCQTRVEAVDDELLGWMKRAGCECVQLGVESGSPRILKELGKQITPEQVQQASDAIHRAGLQLSAYLIAGVPGETDADKTATRELVRRIKPHDLQIAPLTYYPGTALFKAAVRHGKVPANLFEQDHSDALFAKPTGPQETTKLLSVTSGCAPLTTEDSLAEASKRIGYCAVGNMQAGDYFLQTGSTKKAEAAYRTITTAEPDHPWGWLLLAELYVDTGRHKQAQTCFQRLLTLVPHHRQAQQALQNRY